MTNIRYYQQVNTERRDFCAQTYEITMIGVTQITIAKMAKKGIFPNTASRKKVRIRPL